MLWRTTKLPIHKRFRQTAWIASHCAALKSFFEHTAADRVKARPPNLRGRRTRQ